MINIYIAVAIAAVTLILGFAIGMIYRKFVAEGKLGVAEKRADEIIKKAEKEADTKKKEAVLAAKEELHKGRAELDREIKDRRNEINRQERRIEQKENNLDKKTDALDKKEEKLNQKLKELDVLTEETAEINKKQTELLEKISGLSVEEAKEYLLKNIEAEVRHESAIITNAIQKCAADHVAEATVSVVALPNDEMKGRIIGREGRNIRTLETLTGIDLIIDDTPEAVVLSGFDPIRREIARVSLEKLISDGRIHPARIEEVVEKSRKEVEAIIKQEGEQATFETGVHGLHPEIIRLLGKLRFRTSYGQNVLKHAIEVSHLSGIMAGELGVDIKTAKRAGLLHDIGKAMDHEIEGSHVDLGVDIAKKHREGAEVINAIASHHGDTEPTTIIACIVQACDAISAARPGARRENIETYIKRLEKLEEIANSFDGVEKSFAIQAGREIRIMVKPENVKEDETIVVAREIVKRIESELEYPGQIKVNVIRETRSVEYAK